MPKLKVGFVGLGPHAQDNLLPALRLSSDFKLEAVCSRQLEKRLYFSERFDVPLEFESWEKMALDPRIDVVFVSAPPSLHLEVAAFSLKNKKPVFIEKPAAPTLEALGELSRIAQESQTPNFVGFNFRFADAYRTALEQVRGLKHVRITMDSNKPSSPIWGHTTSLESLLYAVGIHAIEAAIDLIGTPLKIEPSVIQLSENKWAVSIHLLGASGKTAQVEISNLLPRFETRFELLGDCSVRLNQLREIEIFDSNSEIKRASTVCSPSPLAGGFSNSGYANEISAFADEIRFNKPALSPIRNSLAVFELIESVIGATHV